MRYKATEEAKKLAIKYQKNDCGIGISMIIPCVKLICDNISQMIEAKMPYDLLKRLLMININEFITEVKFADFVSSITKDIPKDLKKLPDNLLTLRNLFKGDKEFFISNFKEHVPKEGSEEFLDKYIELISKITEEHIKEIMEKLEISRNKKEALYTPKKSINFVEKISSKNSVNENLEKE